MRTYAFYKGTLKENPAAKLFDRMVTAWPRSKGRFSHSERVHVLHGRVFGLSSSFRDKGVREKEINFATGRWVFVDVPGDYEKGIPEFYSQVGKPYDSVGLMGFVLPVWLQLRWAWFCSEINAWMEGIPKPSRMSPSALFAYCAALPGAVVREHGGPLVATETLAQG